jgi:D-glycero-D-manno-heptose 1,7-bisphosphate phosphatase
VRRAIFLDRDGVLNRAILRDGKPYPPPGLAQMELLPDVQPACQRLREADYLLILVTNQPDIARGLAREEDVLAINNYLQQFLGLDDVRVCPHDDASGCACRKPHPGLLIDAARDWDIDLGASYLVGDRWRDIEAAQRAGCSAVFIDYGYPERRPDPPFWPVNSLKEAASLILAADLKETVCRA